MEQTVRFKLHQERRAEVRMEDALTLLKEARRLAQQVDDFVLFDRCNKAIGAIQGLSEVEVANIARGAHRGEISLA